MRKTLVGIRLASHISGRPITTHSACFSNSVYAEPVFWYCRTLEADSTITMPSASSSIEQPSTR